MNIVLKGEKNMGRSTKNGTLFFAVLVLALMISLFAAQGVEANDSEEGEDAAIRAAIEAIKDIRRSPDRIVSLNQRAVDDVAEARALVEEAKDEYGIDEEDIANIDTLRESEERVEKLLAVEEAKEAMDELPPPSEATAEDMPAIERARELVDIAKEDYGATRFDLCWGLDRLEEVEEKVDPEPEPEPDPDPELPPTGGLATSIISGAALTGAGLFFIGKRHKRNRRKTQNERFYR